MVKGKITPNLADKVEFETEVDIFMDLVAHSLKILVSGIIHRLDPCFRMMAAENWGGFEQVRRVELSRVFSESNLEAFTGLSFCLSVCLCLFLYNGILVYWCSVYCFMWSDALDS